LYEDVVALSGADATKARVVEALGGARLVHFAGHIIGNADRPELSHLILAPDQVQEAGILSASEIESLDLSHCELAVLAGCGSGVGRPSSSEGPLSVARAFLAAGSRAVALTLWDIGDIPSAYLLRVFHQSLRSGATPTEALRRAQLACLASSDDRLRDPRVWGAFELMTRSL